jgi:glucosyl-3-phosphoglycerate synthase
MSFAILQTFIKRKKKLGLVDYKEKLYNEMIQYNLIKNEFKPDIYEIEGHERPPIIEIPEYREKFNRIS